MGSPTPNKGIRRGPAALPAFSYQKKNKSVTLKTPIEKTHTKKRDPKRAETAGKGRGSDRFRARGRGLQGGGAGPSPRPAGPCEGAGREGAGPRGAGPALSSRPTDSLGPLPTMGPTLIHTPAPAGLIRDLNDVVQLRRGHGERRRPSARACRRNSRSRARTSPRRLPDTAQSPPTSPHAAQSLSALCDLPP